MFSFFRVSSSFTSPVPSSFPSHYLSPLLPMYYTPSFSSTSSLVPLILRFPSHFPSALYYTPHFPILPLVLPLLPFHIITILLLFVLSFYISFLHTFSSHFSSPSSFVSFLLSTILWFWFLLFSLLYPIILPHVQSVWSYYEYPIPQQCCCLLFTKCMFC